MMDNNFKRQLRQGGAITVYKPKINFDVKAEDKCQ